MMTLNGRRDTEKGTFDGTYTYCTVNAYGACPYADQNGICHVDDPVADCEDFAQWFPTWWDWMMADIDPEVESAGEPDYDLEMGFDPYEGDYTFDC